MRKAIALALAGLLASAGGAFAQSTLEGEITVVHGINGTDLGFGDAGLPVDIAVNGGCALEDVPFRSITGAIPLPAGSYTIDVSLSDGVAGNCDASLLAFSGGVDLAVAESATVIAHLDQNGAARLTKVSNQVGPIAPGDTRVAVIHAAAAPSVDVSLRSRDDDEDDKGRVKIDGLRNGEQSFAADVPAGDYKVRVRPDRGGGSLFRTTLPLDEGVAYTIIAVGTLAKGTFEPLILTITP